MGGLYLGKKNNNGTYMKIIFKSLSIHLIDKFLQWWAKAELQINQPFQMKPREMEMQILL